MVYVKGRSLCRGNCPLPVFQYNIDNANTSLVPRYVRNSIIINTSRFQGGGVFNLQTNRLMLLENGLGVRAGQGRVIHQQIVTCRIKIPALVPRLQALKPFVFRDVE